MKNKMVVLVMAFVLSFASAVYAEFTVTWDENVPKPDGYKLFHRWEGESYDYTKPYWKGPVPPVKISDLVPPVPEILAPKDITAEWNKAESTISINWDQPPSATATKKVYMVARAYLDPIPPETKEEESADSEEISIDQTSKSDVLKWEVFYSETAGGPYTSLGEVPATGNTGITKPLTAVPLGKAKTIYFTVVAFGEDGVNSQDSTETSVLIDRRVLLPPTNMKVTATVPVQ